VAQTGKRLAALELLRVPDTLPGSLSAWKELAVTAFGVTLGLGSPEDECRDTISVPLPRLREPEPAAWQQHFIRSML